MTTITKVPLLDLTRNDPALLDELRAAFDRVLTSGQYIMGPELDGLERECEAYLGAKHALGVSSGTDALILALMALDIGPGDEVICPTYTFFATAGSIWRLGAKPVFVDIDPVTYNCDAAQTVAAITSRTRAIMPVHLFGQSAAMDPILESANSRGIPVIEDAAQAIGTKYGRRSAGTMGTFGCFSFFPSKNLGCMGDGGLVTTNDTALAERARILRVHGGKPKYYHKFVGGNFRLDPLQAAILRVKLPRLNAATEARRRNARLYETLFRDAGVVSASPMVVESGSIGLPTRVDDHIYNQFVVRSPDRDALRKAMADQGIGTEVYYPVPLHLQECFASLGHSVGEFPHSERAAAETLALPIFPELAEAEIRHVAERVIAFCKGGSR
ncbi:MAG: DegT/DnrJ/EryC1/StrS family aminotransferase [Planctomycetota bacterium]